MLDTPIHPRKICFAELEETMVVFEKFGSKKSPTAPFLNGPRQKPEYLIARSQLTERVRWDSVPSNL